ncbi:ABC transporter ATP-binding protein [Paenibacillus lemnae]|uniref:ABC transporter ATP-binding protein n=1 Tax=Paenibacillus lemnae TaxID=1330551 RepID=A0A848M5T7_PAELE|nr:ABC transporter ATP-binding protein [Paenibacillus lemnae]NMO95173.1 ABC transporter ATP-binding protein [Paenibacillus lemnae]
MTQHKIEISGVSKWFRRNGEEIAAMRETNLSIEAGRFVSIIGPSGCGKSTLFNIIAGLMPPSTGKVLADGENIIGKTGYVGYMLQKDMLLPWRTILDNIILGMEVRGVPYQEAVRRALPLMEKYGLKGFDKHYPKELSGGMRQRAALLRTLLYDRDIILLDEPFGALDAQTRLTMQNWLLQIWQDFGKTVLFVTHDIDEAIYLSDDIYVFSSRPGRIKSKITVTMDRPRKTEDMTSPAFMELKHHLMDLLSAGHEEEPISS